MKFKDWIKKQKLFRKVNVYRETLGLDQFFQTYAGHKRSVQTVNEKSLRVVAKKGNKVLVSLGNNPNLAHALHSAYQIKDNFWIEENDEIKDLLASIPKAGVIYTVLRNAWVDTQATEWFGRDVFYRHAAEMKTNLKRIFKRQVPSETAIADVAYDLSMDPPTDPFTKTAIEICREEIKNSRLSTDKLEPVRVACKVAKIIEELQKMMPPSSGKSDKQRDNGEKGKRSSKEGEPGAEPSPDNKLGDKSSDKSSGSLPGRSYSTTPDGISGDRADKTTGNSQSKTTPDQQVKASEPSQSGHSSDQHSPDYTRSDQPDHSRNGLPDTRTRIEKSRAGPGRAAETYPKFSSKFDYPFLPEVEAMINAAIGKLEIPPPADESPAREKSYLRHDQDHTYRFLDLKQEKVRVDKVLGKIAGTYAGGLPEHISRTGIVTPSAWRLNTGHTKVFKKPELIKEKIIVLIDLSGSMGCWCETHEGFYGWIAFQSAAALGIAFPDSTFVYGFCSTDKKNYLVPIEPGYAPLCREKQSVPNGNPDCVALQFLESQYTNLSATIAVIISDGTPAGPFPMSDEHVRQHTQDLSHELHRKGLRFYSILATPHYPADLYPADISMVIESPEHLPRLQTIFEDIVRSSEKL